MMIINKMVVKTGSTCSLRCAKCGEFNPYLVKNGKSFSVTMEQLTKDVIKVAQAVESISLIDVAGGEALTHSNLYVFIQSIAQIENIKKIHIVSNGTIVPDKLMLDVLKKYADKVSIIISDYSKAGVNNTLTISTLKENGVKFQIIHDMVWVDKSDTQYKNYNKKDLEYIANHCSTFKKEPYYTLINGKLSAHCPTAGSLMYYLGLYEECAGEYIDIRDLEILDTNILKEMDSHKILQACNYCVPSYLARECMAGEQL